MNGLFNEATNLREMNQGVRGEQIYKYMTNGFEDACAMPKKNLQGNRITKRMTPILDVETALRQAPQVDYVNLSRPDAPQMSVPMQGINVPDCQQDLRTGYVKRRVTDREIEAPELVLRAGPLQTGVMQLGEDTRTTFKYSAQPDKSGDVSVVVSSLPTASSGSPRTPLRGLTPGQTLLEALTTRDKRDACKLSFRTYPAKC